MEYLNKIKEIVGQKGYLDTPTDLAHYSRDRNPNFDSSTDLVVFPRTKQEVQAIVECANQFKRALVPSGGRTGLCGGATATNGAVVVSLEKMNKVIEINQTERIAICEPGVITEVLQAKLAESNLYFPLSLASQGSSQIGGNIATNAGGMHFIRYGSIRNWVLGLEVVTGDGKVLRTGKSVYKDQTGIDLKSLFIGSEGTLGIITELTLALATPPANGHRALLAAQSISDLLSTLQKLRGQFPQLTLFEYFDHLCLEKVLEHTENKPPFKDQYPLYALIEVEGQSTEIFEEFLMQLLNLNLVDDVVIPQSSTQSFALLELREQISETLTTHYAAYKNDISLPISTIESFLTKLKTSSEDKPDQIRCATFGHLGDGNLHLNFLNCGLPEPKFLTVCKEWNQELLEVIASKGGSISAEHGIGLLKKDYLHLSRSDLEIDYMKKIKQVFDPNGIMNPGKIWD